MAQPTGGPGKQPAAWRTHFRVPPWLLSTLAVTFLLQLAVYAARPTVTYRALELGAHGAGLGAIVAAFAVLSLVCAVPVGWWVDRWGDRPFLTAGAILIAASAFALIDVQHLALLGVMLALLGLGHLFVAVSVQTLIAARAGPGHSASYFGLFTVVVALGQLSGPALLGILGGRETGAADGQPMFAAAGAAAVAATVLTLALPGGDTHHRPTPHHDERPGIGRAGLRVLRRPNMARAVLASLTVVASIDALIAYLPAYGQAAGLSVSTVGFLLATRSAASLVSRASMGTAVRRVGLGRLLVGCTAGSAAALALLPLLNDVAWALYVLMAFAGLGLGLGQPLTLTWVAKTTPTEIRSTALAVRLAGNRLGQVVIPAAVGGLIAVAGPFIVFWALATMLGASSAANAQVRAEFDQGG